MPDKQMVQSPAPSSYQRIYPPLCKAIHAFITSPGQSVQAACPGVFLSRFTHLAFLLGSTFIGASVIKRAQLFLMLNGLLL